MSQFKDVALMLEVRRKLL